MPVANAPYEPTRSGPPDPPAWMGESRVAVEPGVWPRAAALALAAQNPSAAFGPKHLRNLRLERDLGGLPRVWAGANTVVWKAADADGRPFALRAWTDDGFADKVQRLKAAAPRLAPLKLPGFTPWQFFLDGVRPLGESGWLPLQVLEWAEGEPLDGWLRGRCAAGQRDDIARLADTWDDLVHGWEAAGVVHGDLRPDHIRVANAGTIRLIDYDAVTTPDAFGRPVGSPGRQPFRHPRHDAGTPVGPGFDRYAALVIGLGLKALAADPDLWRRFGAPEWPFGPDDAKDVSRSPVLTAARALKNEDVQRLIAALGQAHAAGEVASPLATLTPPFTRIGQCLRDHDADAALALAERLPDGHEAWRSAPAGLVEQIAAAKERARCRDALKRAIESGDEEALAKLAEAGGPADEPLLAVAKDARRVLGLLAELDEILARRDGRAAVRLWDGHAALLGPRVSAKRRGEKVERWRARNRACDAVLKAVTGEDAALVDLWEKLEKLGGHPEAELHRPRLTRLAERAAAWREYQAVPAGPTADNDRRRLEAWREDLFAGWPPAEAERDRLKHARRRRDLLAAAPGNDQPNETIDRALVEHAGKLPPGYAADLTRRANLAMRRVEALDRFRERLRARPAAEGAIADAWRALDTAGGAGLASPAETQRAELAIARQPLLDGLNALAEAPIGVDRDNKLRVLYKADLLDDCPEAARWRGEYPAAIQRLLLVKAAKIAIKAKDNLRAVELLDDPRLAGYVFLPTWDTVLPAIRKSGGPAHALLAAVRAGDAAAFLKAFDARLLGEYRAAFAPYSETVAGWSAAAAQLPEAAPRARPYGGAGLVQTRRGHYELRWVWPAARFAERCVVAVTGDLDKVKDGPDAVTAVWHTSVGARDYERYGGWQPLEAAPDWDGAAVIVWAQIEVAVATLYSRPLVLGTIGEPAPRRR